MVKQSMHMKANPIHLLARYSIHVKGVLPGIAPFITILCVWVGLIYQNSFIDSMNQSIERGAINWLLGNNTPIKVKKNELENKMNAGWSLNLAMSCYTLLGNSNDDDCDTLAV